MYVFIDTNIFYEKKFNFDNDDLSDAEKLLCSDEITLITTDLHIKELNKKVLNYVDKKFTYDNKSDSIDELIKTEEQKTELISLKDKMDHFKENLIRYFQDEIDKFMARVKPISLQSDDVNMMEMFDYYLKTKPPFADKKDKRKEYPDTVMLLNLKKYAEEFNTPISVISYDQGVKEFCLEHDNLDYYKTISDWTDYVNKSQENYQKAHRVLQQPKTFYSIAEEVLQYPFKLSMFDAPFKTEIFSVEPVSIPHDNALDYDITSINSDSSKTKVKAQVNLNVIFIISGEEPDLSEMHVDKNNEEIYFHSYFPFSSRQVYELPFSVSLTLSNDEKDLEWSEMRVNLILDNPLKVNINSLDDLVGNLFSPKTF